jgi:hypothetical protein
MEQKCIKQDAVVTIGRQGDIRTVGLSKEATTASVIDIRRWTSVKKKLRSGVWYGRLSSDVHGQGGPYRTLDMYSVRCFHRMSIPS